MKFQEPLNPHQGDREGRPYNMTLPVLPDSVYVGATLAVALGLVKATLAVALESSSVGNLGNPTHASLQPKAYTQDREALFKRNLLRIT